MGTGGWSVGMWGTEESKRQLGGGSEQRRPLEAAGEGWSRGPDEPQCWEPNWDAGRGHWFESWVSPVFTVLGSVRGT